MRIAFIAPLFALALTGCASGLSPQSIGTAVNNINATVLQVQAIAKQVCSFVPAAVTVSSILNQFIPGLSTAESVAKSICDAVAPAGVPAARRSRTVPMVAGVVIRGQFKR